MVSESVRAHLPREVEAARVRVLPLGRGRWRDRRELLRLRGELRGAGIERLVINTAEGTTVRDLCLLLPREIELVGVLHHVEKLGRSTTQRWITRSIRKYLVLGDQLLPEPGAGPPGVAFHAMYPTVFPAGTPPADLPAGFRVCIPGQLEHKRRDYRGLLEALRSTRDLHPALHLVLLGDATRGDGPEIRVAIREAGLADRVTTYEGFVAPERFFGTLAACDVVAPLIQPGTGHWEDYTRHRISGTFNLALGARKPLVVHERLLDLPFFDVAGIGHGDGELLGVLERLAGAPDAVAGVAAAIGSLERLDPERQADRYVRFLESTPGSSTEGP